MVMGHAAPGPPGRGPLPVILVPVNRQQGSLPIMNVKDVGLETGGLRDFEGPPGQENEAERIVRIVRPPPSPPVLARGSTSEETRTIFIRRKFLRSIRSAVLYRKPLVRG